MKRRAFSLLELLLVLAVLLVLVAVAWPSLARLQEGQRRDQVVADVLGRLGSARVRAIERSRVHEFEFAPRGQQYVVRLKADQERTTIHDDRLPDGFFFSRPADSPATVSFYPDGTADAAAIGIIDGRGSLSTIRVHPLTGRARK